MDLGQKGVFWFTDALTSAQLVELAQRTEEFGYAALWYPEALGYESFSLASFLLSHRQTHNEYHIRLQSHPLRLPDHTGGRAVIGETPEWTLWVLVGLLDPASCNRLRRGPGRTQARANSRSLPARSRYSVLARRNENECSSDMHS